MQKNNGHQPFSPKPPTIITNTFNTHMLRGIGGLILAPLFSLLIRKFIGIVGKAEVFAKHRLDKSSW